MLLAALGTVVFCEERADESDAASTELLAWAQGPVRWLLMPAEWRDLKKIDEPAQAINFIEAFWRLRDPNSRTENNEYRSQFAARVEAADQLYTEEGVRGSLTDRGRALILLGPPPHLRVGTEVGLVFKAGRRAGKRSTTREIRVEVWRYPESELPDKFVRVRRAADQDPTVELKFHLGRRGAQLAEGANSLILASRLALIQD